jgi:aspartate/methionine/tyrosine aminotransferase
MNYQRMAIEEEAPEEVGAVIRYNLSESAISDQTLQSLGISIPQELVLGYTEHQGSRQIRNIIAEASGGSVTADDIIVTAGASTSLFIVATSLLGPDDHFIVTRPNYATSLETPRAIGCSITFIDLDFASQYRLDVARISAAIRPGITKLISICSPNNPTGTVCSASTLQAVAAVAAENGCHLLIDETYADLTYADSPIVHRNDGGGDDDDGGRAERRSDIPAAASLGSHVIGVSSMSKVYGVPGIRIGWLATTNKVLLKKFLAAKEQISISGSVLDELVAEQILSRRDALLRETKAEMRRRRDRVAAWIESESDLVDWVAPEAGVMCFVRMKKPPASSPNAFYRRLLLEHGTYVGPGHWFERDDVFFRLGFGWPTWEHLEAGLRAISEALRA